MSYFSPLHLIMMMMMMMTITFCVPPSATAGEPRGPVLPVSPSRPVWPDAPVAPMRPTWPVQPWAPVHTQTDQTSAVYINTLQGKSKQIFQYENYDISEMREYFCTKFCPFVYKTTVQKCAALYCIYLANAKLTEMQTSGTNFSTAQKVDIVKVSSIDRPSIPPLLRRQCNLIILSKCRMLINVLIF